MVGIGKIVTKAALVLAGAVALGYAEYRLKGGEPIHKLYKEVKNERLAWEAVEAKRTGKVITTEGSVR